MKNNLPNSNDKLKYTCNEYREEMILASLRQRLTNSELTEEQRYILIKEIEKIEKEMGF
ncbi:MAG: hypothetical protein HQK69_02320 [Desulfamplus sp.]|nr:hypothetical protein [Desulfamplus sp.]